MWKPEDYCSDNLIYKGLFEWIANLEEEFTYLWKKHTCVSITEKKILVMVPVQSILLIPLRVIGDEVLL